jgi:hypothetical protein
MIDLCASSNIGMPTRLGSSITEAEAELALAKSFQAQPARFGHGLRLLPMLFDQTQTSASGEAVWSVPKK